MFFIKNPKGLLVFIKVKAGAKNTYVKEYVPESPSKGFLKVYIKAPPEKGAANRSLIKFLAQEWHIPQKDLELIHGATSHSKTLLIYKESTIQEQDLLQWAEKKALDFSLKAFKRSL